jgi:hypothetical protein
MIDLNALFSKHIIAAARAHDVILGAARSMTVAPRHERVRLRDGCREAVDEMRRLARDYFDDRLEIPPAIDALERSPAELAALPVPADDGPPAETICPACGSALDQLPVTDAAIYCPPCLDRIRPPLAVLRSSEEGFGTDGILRPPFSGWTRIHGRRHSSAPLASPPAPPTVNSSVLRHRRAFLQTEDADAGTEQGQPQEAPQEAGEAQEEAEVPLHGRR